MLNWPLMSAQLLLETFVPLTRCIHQYQHVAPAIRLLLSETTLVSVLRKGH